MSEHVVVFVEVPSGSRNKYELDEELGAIVLDRRLFTSMAYPADYGFIEGTLGGDGDPLDALVLVGEPTFPGCRIRGRVVGVFHMADEKGPDEKIICVPLKDPAWMRVSDVHDIPAELRNEIEHFFQVYKDLEEAKVETRGYGNRAEAMAIIAASRLPRADAYARSGNRRSRASHVESAEHGCSEEEAAASSTRPFAREEADETLALAARERAARPRAARARSRPRGHPLSRARRRRRRLVARRRADGDHRRRRLRPAGRTRRRSAGCCSRAATSSTSGRSGSGWG